MYVARTLTSPHAPWLLEQELGNLLQVQDGVPLMYTYLCESCLLCVHLLMEFPLHMLKITVVSHNQQQTEKSSECLSSLMLARGPIYAPGDGHLQCASSQPVATHLPAASDAGVVWQQCRVGELVAARMARHR